VSTYLYLRCEDHTPPLVATEESGQHTYDLPRIRAEIADRENVADRYARYGGDFGDQFDSEAYFRAHSARFLADHPTCRIGIVDEYGRDHPVDPKEAPDGR